MYSIPQNSFVFGFVGRLVPEKGINELLEAFLSIKVDVFITIEQPKLIRNIRV